MGTYRTAEMCPNGHHTTSNIEYSELRSSFCPECGEKTFIKCRHCETDIRGHYHVDGVVSFSDYQPPNHCHQCGHAFPWTEQRFLAAQTLIDELEELGDEDKDLLKQAVSDLKVNNPQTELAASRYSRIKKKISTTSASTLDSLVGNLVTEGVKLLIGSA